MKDLVYLAQTDTTVGFLSQNSEKLYRLKSREESKPFIKVCDSNKTLMRFTRVPKKYRKMVRNAKKSTFVYKDQAIRVVKDQRHLRFLKKLRWCYSTSANESGKTYEKDFANDSADVIVYDVKEFDELIPSKIYKLQKDSIRRLR
jgi:tRNA A37 threonylcarbamoyladenosine synthetase subunit TsaC/SUA5/YrdC